MSNLKATSIEGMFEVKFVKVLLFDLANYT